jgi:hypothetical protein
MRKKTAPAQGANLRDVHAGALKLHPARHYIGGLSVPTMHRLVKKGLLKPCRSVRHLLFSVKELDRFLEDGAK